MAKAKNYHLYSTNPEQIARWKEEYEFIGRQVKRTPEGLVVFALPQKPVKKKAEKRGKTDEARNDKPRERTNR
jgi:hypothetical protein